MNIKEIEIANQNICKNINKIRIDGRGFISQNILGQLRNLVESIAVAILAKQNSSVSSRNYPDIQKGLLNIKSQGGKYKDLRKFHSMLQMSVSHYTVDEQASERLMLKYYESLLRLKKLVRKELDLEILENIVDFPLNLDPQLTEYYTKIADKIDCVNGLIHISNDRFYIHKIKPFFVDQKIYYEVSFVLATNNTSKFERVIAFTRLDIMSNYAVKFSIHRQKINVFNKEMEIFIINDWELSIRPCEIENFSKIFQKDIKGTSQEDKGLMRWLQDEKINLVELINSSDSYYNYIKGYVVAGSISKQFFSVLDICRNRVLQGAAGKNIIQYLLYIMNNKIVKAQFCRYENYIMKGLYLRNESIPFDQMPFATSPCNHNPRLQDLIDCFDTTGREHELFARKICQKNEEDRSLFINISDFENQDDVESLMEKFNSKLYIRTKTQKERSLSVFNKNIYITGYVNACVEILAEINKLTDKGLSNYANSMIKWLSENPNIVDCDEKKTILQNLFIDSQVAIIYGAAGTGKSTLIKNIAEYFSSHNKLFLTNTNTAKSNLERRITIENCTYKTIKKFLSEPIHTDILFIDEASTISNRDMRSLLAVAKFKLLVLVGDNYQIESINFGNWFDIVREFIPRKFVYELTKTYRTDNSNLLQLWDKVRRLDPSILESLVVRETDSYSQNLDETIFENTEKDQIILCLNYDGLYGINNINRLLQEANKNQSISWGVSTYKIGDPILFNESKKSSDILYNNLKGWIVDFTESEHSVLFSIEIDAVLDESDFWNQDLTFIGTSNNGNAIIGLSVDKFINTDEDDMTNKKTMPFQIAYAISIHKAQGLEYDSVKIIINNEMDEAITHDIFYTAITRAKHKLKIYWSPESENKILDGLCIRNYNKDIEFIKKYIENSK